jgi:hypothetical protein
MMIDKKIAFLGGGKMAEALVKGLIAAGTITPNHISSPFADCWRSQRPIIIQSNDAARGRSNVSGGRWCSWRDSHYC